MPKFPPDTKTLQQYFRGFLIAEIALFVIILPIELFSGMVTDAAMEDAGMSTELTGPDAAVAGLACIFLVFGVPALIASWVGLFLSKPWARWLYLATNGIFYGIYLPVSLLDFTMAWGFPGALSDIASVITGIIIAILFFTTVAEDFGSTAPSRAPVEPA